MYESSRGQSLAAYTLPYLAGSKQIVGRKYGDMVVATVTFLPLDAFIAIGAVALSGIVAGLFIPRLPNGVPRRGFDLLTWLTALFADGLAEQLPPDFTEKRRGYAEEKDDIDEVRELVGDLRLRFPLQE